jgi:CDP-diacylglycerol--glycerol-3-phosphate 3-phosphatidyltransferase
MLKSEIILQRCAYKDGPVWHRLQAVWWTACLFSLLFIMGGFSWLYFLWQPLAAFQWLLQTAGINAYVLWLLWTGLAKNHSPQNTVLQPDLGVANWLTIGRGFLISALGGFLFQKPPASAAGPTWLIWVPGLIYINAILLDYLDGYLARLTRSESRLGEWLDTKIDALGLFVAPILAIGYHRLPIFYISVSLAYYIFQFVIWHRKKHDQLTLDIKPHPAKRMIAGFQMGLVAIALLPIFSRPAMTIAAAIFMIPLLAGFVRDALVIGGTVKVNPLQQTRWDCQINYALTKQLPVILRLIIIAIILFLCNPTTYFFSGIHNAAVAALDASMPFDLPALPMLAASGLMIALGFMARSGALLISIFVASTLTGWDSPFYFFLLLSCALTLMLTGSGLCSLWQPEDKLLMERQG